MIYDYEVEKISNDKTSSEFYVAMSKSLRGCVGQGATTEEQLRSWKKTRECGLIQLLSMEFLFQRFLRDDYWTSVMV